MLLRYLGVFGLMWLGLGQALAGATGAQLYQQNCAVCHGETGNGGIGIPLALP
jgi:cytochrome c oxidase cbb3-type subunit 3